MTARAFLTAALVLATGCAPDAQRAPAPAKASHAPRVSAPFEISPASRFTRDGDGFRSARVRVTHDELSVSATAERAGCRFRTQAIGARAAQPAVAAEVDGALAIARDGAREELVPHPRGVEQRWVFASRPSGPLEVVVAFDGRFVDARDGDAHFACPDGGLAIYGAATFVDANGVRTPVAREIRDGTIVLRVPDDVASNAAYPAVLDPIVGPALEVDTPVGEPHRPKIEAGVAAASGSAGWMTAWFSSDDQLWVRHVEADGVLAWPAGVHVGASYLRGAPALSYDGANWLVVWNRGDSVLARRVSPKGTLLDSEPLTIVAASLPVTHTVGAAWDGTRHAVVDHRRAAFVSASGVVTGSVDLPVLEGEHASWSGIGCRSDGQCLVVGVSGAHTVAVRLAGGALVDASPISLGSPSTDLQYPAYLPRAVWSGSSWIVVTDKSRGPSSSRWDCELHAIRVDADGTELGDWTFGRGSAPDVSCGSGRCRIVYSDPAFEIRSLRIDAAGTPLDVAPTTLDPAGAFPRVVCSADRCLTVSSDFYSTHGVRTEGTTVLDGSPLVLSMSPSVQNAASVAAAGSTALVVWDDRRAARGLYAARVTESGPVDGAAKLVAAGIHGQFRAGALGSEWVVVYHDEARLVSRWIDASGSPGSESTLATQAGLADVACSDSSCLAVWMDGRHAGGLGVYAKRLGKAAGLHGPDIPIATPALLTYDAAVLAAAPSGFLVVYRDSNKLAWARRVDDAGALGAPIPLGFHAAFYMTLAWADGVWILAWSEDDGPVTSGRIRLARLAAAGSPAGAPSTILSGDLFGSVKLSRSRDGHTALLTWTASGVRGAFVANDGRVLDPGGFVVATEGSGHLSAAPIAAGKALVTYQRTAGMVLSRIHARVVESGALDGATCTDGATCASRRCVDGVCCDRACDGACETCGTGTCTGITSADDPEKCTGDFTCSASATCAAKPGRPCASATDCASGFCVEGVCCDSACGACGSCTATPGTCTPKTAGTPACGAYVCDGASPTCPTTCADDAGCAADAYCGADAQCHPRKALGAACDPTLDCATGGCRACASGHCVEGVCCDGACDGGCGSCTKAGAVGTCSPVGAGTTSTCAPYVCDGASARCPATCATSAGCASDAWCAAGACKPRVAIGFACTHDGECTAGAGGVGRCVDGVCCASACSGLCEACDVPGALGTCTAVLGAPHPGHGSCADDASQPLCGRRVCDGVARDTCGKRAGAETVCSPHACVDGRETTEARCADGVCPAAVTRDCAPYRCGPAGACATTCTGSSACAAGFECVDGACVTPDAPAADPAPHDASGGCRCRVGSASRDGASVLALAAVALALARRRRGRYSRGFFGSS